MEEFCAESSEVEDGRKRFNFRLIGFLFRSLIDQLILRSFERVNQYFSGVMPGVRGGGDQQNKFSKPDPPVSSRTPLAQFVLKSLRNNYCFQTLALTNQFSIENNPQHFYCHHKPQPLMAHFNHRRLLEEMA